MAANVTYIPPKAAKPEALRVAAYCRVSSDSSDQLHSYATQIKAYTEQIGAHTDWELVDVYADEGLTGTRMDKREDFQRLLADCRKGKVDRVLCKSISRFARNTKDCLAALRELSALGVTVYFEKENIDTGTLTSELMVSVSGALAQQESISISQNQRMSYKRRMERGEFITCKAPFGYRLVEGKELEIIPEEAERVRWIFASYLSGKSLEWIAEQMENEGSLLSCDIYAHKIDLMEEGAERLGISIMQCRVKDAAAEEESPKQFDRVLADVPCSGLGLMRKKPDIRLKKDGNEIDSLTKMQREILENAAGYVKKGGVLVYSTCTLCRKENEKNLEWFLAQHPDFTAEDISEFLPEGWDTETAKKGYLTLLPHKTGTDGFFISKLRRKD